MDIWRIREKHRTAVDGNSNGSLALKTAVQVAGDSRKKRSSPALSPMNKEFSDIQGMCFENDAQENTVLKEAKPYIHNGAELVIPMDAPDKYRWWSGGQSVLDTLLELDAPDSVIEHYVGEIGTPDMWKKWQKILEDRIAARPVAGHRG